MKNYAEMQEWKGMDGATAYQLISRHADGWADIRGMMEAWHEANTPPAPEPNMFWLAGAEETPAVEMPLRIAEEIEEELGIGIGIVECAVRLPDRKMRVWTEKNADGDEVTKWEWVSE